MLGLVVALAAEVTFAANLAHGQAVATDHMIVLDHAIGAASLGTARTTIDDRLGPGRLLSRRIEGSGNEPRVRIEVRVYGGLQVTFASSAGSTRPSHQRAVLLDTSDPAYRTASRVGVGAPWTAVLALGGTRSSLGTCTQFTYQCQHGSVHGTEGLTLFYQGPDRRISRIVITRLG